jgi:UDP-sulfoquinovose synthase
MRVLILGGDGYLGWPTAMYFSARGHEVAVVDNYLRRNLARETDNDILYPTPNLHVRTSVWKEHSGNDMAVYIGDLCDWSFINQVFQDFKPDTIVHYAEQPSAPYSMLSADAARLTVNNNLGVTLNVVLAMKAHCPDAHLIKLGTMGEYGTPNIDIEEGWLTIEHKGRSHKFLFPRQAGSLYHTTKVMDTDLLWFYVRTWGLRVTDLMQGPVYGIFTDENEHDDRLLPCFAYDEVFGTVLNRFIVQAVAGYPLTVYGKGGQTRGYLNIKDTMQCIMLSAENPSGPGELNIYNQFTETFTVNELAEKVKNVGARLGIDVQVRNIENPRKELEEHYYNPAHTGLMDLGLQPNYLDAETLGRMIEKVRDHEDRIDPNRIFRGVKWD